MIPINMTINIAVTTILSSGLSLTGWVEKRRERLELKAGKRQSSYAPSSIQANPEGSASAPLLGAGGVGLGAGPRSGVSGLSGRAGFEVSIGQDVVDKEGSLVQEDRSKRDLLEHSYSSLSDYHSYRQ